jgi:hypothetical protein
MPEVHFQYVEVDAETEASARKKVLDGEGDYLDQPEFSRTLSEDWENWEVEEAD